MQTKEVFPVGKGVEKVAKAFNAVIAQVVGKEDAPPLGPRSPLLVVETIAHAVASLQNWVYIPVSDDFVAREEGNADQDVRVQLILPFWSLTATRIAYGYCAEIWNRLSAGEEFADIDALRLTLSDKLTPYVASSVNQFALVKGAVDLNLNLIRMPGEVLCLGTGTQSRLMNSTLTDRSANISIMLARDKALTAKVLRMSGLPGARNQQISSADEAVQTAEEFGFPVVIKPADLDRGDGVAAFLANEVAVREAYAKARALTEKVLVEEHVNGFTHRLTVVDGKVISVRQRVPGGVTGDGKSTVSQLVETHKQSEWSRRWMRSRGRVPVDLDAEALDVLEQENVGVETILPEGQFQRLRRRDNINAGGSNRDVPLEDVHADNLELAVSAARAIRLDIAGIDLITTDIKRSWREVGARICEINGKPQFAARHTPELYHELLSRVVGPQPHVPAHLVLCADDLSVRAALVKVVEARKRDQTISMREGLIRNGALLTAGFSDGYAAAWAAAVRSDVEEMTCMMSFGEVFQLGSPLREWTTVSIKQAGLSAEETRLIPDVSRALGLDRAKTKNAICLI
jgi:cyanophycin synthetase